jgi:hypothetical protein
MTDDDCERITEVDLRPAIADFRRHSYDFLTAGLEWCECGALDVLQRRDDWDGGKCEGCADKAHAEAMAEWDWMRAHVRASEAARRSGDFEEAERIKNDVLRYDSPFDPHAIRRRA